MKAASPSAGMCSPTSIQMDSYLRILLLPAFASSFFSLPHTILGGVIMYLRLIGERLACVSFVSGKRENTP